MLSTPFIVPFSGGCFSGKTTAMLEVQRLLSTQYRCQIVEEPIRKLDIKSIDTLRKNPSEYLKLQLQITPARIRHELSLKETGMPVIFLIDRTLADSMFYPQFYLNTDKLSDDELASLKGLFALMQGWSSILYKRVYSHTLFFKPLEIECLDAKFRPKRIDILKYIESDMILNLTKAFTADFTVLNMNFQKPQEIVDIILSKIPNHEVYKIKTR